MVRERTGKQSYICSDCGRTFVKNPKTISSKNILNQNISPEKMFEGDIWI